MRVKFKFFTWVCRGRLTTPQVWYIYMYVYYFWCVRSFLFLSQYVDLLLYSSIIWYMYVYTNPNDTTIQCFYGNIAKINFWFLCWLFQKYEYIHISVRNICIYLNIYICICIRRWSCTVSNSAVSAKASCLKFISSYSL